MKSFLLFLFTFLLLQSNAQPKTSGGLPPGRYETSVKPGTSKWERGDIILLDDNRYRISTSEEIGEYRVSVAAQRIMFTSGPLRAVYAKVVQQGKKPAIELPFAENSHQHLATADIVAVWKQ
ncbi:MULTISPECIES: hypothetical protein [Chitinophagaceae]|uniref:hypothetical protein n=1 Tax=Chitinophagaceae TaxID=563835 RepID=UPI000DEF1558|nr:MULTISPECIES: hypothetical protein [Chitinophagaceae]RPD43785.1 hypothetical protein DRJ53_18530 [Paracnuella aquatica]